ncbi:unnamed protein product [Sphagnum balticum]
MAKTWLLVVLVNTLLVFVSNGIRAEMLGEANCEDLGFTGLALCSDCDSLAEYVKDQELETDCRKCCTPEAEDAISKVMYARALLEICMRKLAFYPDVQTFIDDRLKQFWEVVDVQYRYGSPPKLILKDENGNHKETIRIDNWKTDQIEQFLVEKVKRSSTTS